MTFEAKAKVIKIWPRGQGLTLKTTSLYTKWETTPEVSLSTPFETGAGMRQTDSWGAMQCAALQKGTHNNVIICIWYKYIRHKITHMLF